MVRARRTDAEIQGQREAVRIAATLGGELRRSRRRRRLTQRALGARVGLTQGRISELERGQGWTAPLATWVALGLAIGRPIGVAFARAAAEHEPADAGHLAAQELVVRLARGHGRRADVELPTRAAHPVRSIDVALRDDRRRTLIVVEIWNRLDDVGAALRATSRKAADASALAVMLGGPGPPYRVAGGWLLVDTAANRRLTRRLPALLAARHPGSSAAWVRCLVAGNAAPSEPALAWIDPRSGRITPARLGLRVAAGAAGGPRAER